ncbi:MPN527 family putative ECF transporter permease subunit [Mycoplasma elephantis]|uniref:MPN527 family putative ECF transporter permease subunit n=1 Tax=Mycoplasma elephantis TaxID=114882 RepID=UPI000485F759|nr:hypothetical protein [Mycoplasma elephantis]
MDTNNRYNSVVIKVAYLGIMLSLVILFNYLANFISIVGFLKLDLSSIFIIISFLYISKQGAIYLLFIRFAIGPSYSQLGYELASILGHFILFCTTLFFILFLYLFMFILKKNKLNYLTKQIIIYLICIVICSFLMFILNSLLFVPLYLYIFKAIDTPCFHELVKKWTDSKFNSLTFGINNYWFGMFILYIFFNFLSFGTNSVGCLLLEITFKKTKIITPNLFN